MIFEWTDVKPIQLYPQLKLTESEKEKVDSNLWKELESLNTEHQVAIKKLREMMEKDKQEALNMVGELI